MDRREFINKSSFLAGALPIGGLLPTYITKMMEQEKYQFKLGKFDCTIYRDLMWKYNAKDYFINADQEALTVSLKKYALDADNIPSPFIAVLLQDESRKILIDTGSGYLDEPLVFRGNEFIVKGKLARFLAQDGVAGEEITDVILTHFHLDHIGGVFTEKGKLNYPNAMFHVSDVEWDFWHSSKSDEQIPLFKYYIEKNITPLKNENLNLVKGDFEEIIPGITAVNAAGHTPGQLALIINQEERGNRLLYVSDSFLHPLHIENIKWQTNYDFDNNKAERTRVKLLDLAYKEDMMINAFHFDFPGLGAVQKENSNWKWVYLK
ncbi:MBL fold metallo-hydrolase [Pricia sp.]|uniref:MBL fold metallo-hydrolase n=1 Tax=Pricia sp. TaxID=2268138 RepID=UPI0035934529